MNDMPPIYLRPSDLAKRWGIQTKTLANWRSEGTGVDFHRLGGAIRYAIADVEAYERKHREETIR